MMAPTPAGGSEQKSCCDWCFMMQTSRLCVTSRMVTRPYGASRKARCATVAVRRTVLPSVSTTSPARRPTARASSPATSSTVTQGRPGAEPRSMPARWADEEWRAGLAGGGQDPQPRMPHGRGYCGRTMKMRRYPPPRLERVTSGEATFSIASTQRRRSSADEAWKKYVRGRERGVTWNPNRASAPRHSSAPRETVAPLRSEMPRSVVPAFGPG
mmetsp:Transcript_26317/g.76445  ORF Transcript_26317/g.76445 Transcript_26317/m.76445 type:complete len:214 (+) Transcript_26317:796-1437(+)